ncbi:MAG: ATP-binding protein [Acidobacteria bacterium]|nr:ATP-binding protein [Acidobacteriota bacterium]
MRKLGVFEVDDFFPPKDRTALAMTINGLVASPSFASWVEGEPLDIETMLWKDGRPRAAIVYLAHLSDDERQFVVTLLLSKVITWMRTKAGTGDLRALIYMDEVFGFVPPTAEPPAKKPILTLLKQARAFGVGLLLSTQNPVDLDYKAMSNAGTWCIGRLQTERDKARILEALQSASGATDVKELDATISGLAKRQFLLHNTRDKAPSIFTTRWALSYLRGPLTREQVSGLTNYVPRRQRNESNQWNPIPIRIRLKTKVRHRSCRP